MSVVASSGSGNGLPPRPEAYQEQTFTSKENPMTRDYKVFMVVSLLMVTAVVVTIVWFLDRAL